MRQIATACLLLLACLSPLAAFGQGLRDQLRDFVAGEIWIYDDWKAAREIAARQKKPVFAVFRCVP